MIIHKQLRRSSLVLLAAATTAVLGTNAAVADAPDNGCARGFSEWDVSAEPYQADNASDANEDGTVCARATGSSFSLDGQTFHTIYVFQDNDLPASG